MADKPKVFNDPIHGHIELHSILVKIIDTPQFQRLRNIKQLGGAYYVYPGASHNRFEHSIGVAHLAGELLQALKEKKPNLGTETDGQKIEITDNDILCVQIAGLCHDLGHGPFSHLFDRKFIPKARQGHNWKHEKASQEMFDHLVKENKLEKAMEDLDLDLDFIKELIDPKSAKETTKRRNKPFLYDVVSNKRNEIDVDKWDYFARDCHHLGIQSNFDCHRLIKFARVCKDEKNMMQICYRDKEAFNLYNMFYTRFSLHKRAYQHRVVNNIEWMITDAFLKADKHIKFEGKNGKMLTLSTAIDDMVAYTKLTDNVFEQILNHPSADEDIKKAKEILDRVLKRDLYRCLVDSSKDIEKIEAEWEKKLTGTNPEDFVVHKIKLDYGKHDKDPIEDVRFYQKNNSNEAKELSREDVSNLLPAKFEETIIRIYCKRRNDKEAGMQQFCKIMKMTASEESLP